MEAGRLNNLDTWATIKKALSSRRVQVCLFLWIFTSAAYLYARLHLGIITAEQDRTAVGLFVLALTAPWISEELEREMRLMSPSIGFLMILGWINTTFGRVASPVAKFPIPQLLFPLVIIALRNVYRDHNQYLVIGMIGAGPTVVDAIVHTASILGLV